uniref:Uncharacterized protein n=1 Tax=Rhizophora mucronata TaxID=61149 RepID=A0A2P2INT5_RHIMU
MTLDMDHYQTIEKQDSVDNSEHQENLGVH